MLKKSLLAAILGFILVIPVVNAIFDPVEFYTVHPDMISNKEYGMYKIDTAFWGIDIADIELMDNSDACITNCYAKLRIKAYQDIDFNSDEFGFKFKNILTENMKYNNFNIYLNKTAQDYWKEDICTKYTEKEVYNEKNKTTSYYTVCSETETVLKNKTYEVELPIDFSDFKIYDNQEIYLTIRGTKSPSENIDWRMDFLGYELKNWAWWNTSWNDRYNLTLNNTDTLESHYNEIYCFDISTTSCSLDPPDARIVLNETNETAYDFYNSSMEKICFIANQTIEASTENTDYQLFCNSTVAPDGNTSIFLAVGGYQNFYNADTTGDWATSEAGAMNLSSDKYTDTNHSVLINVTSAMDNDYWFLDLRDGPSDEIQTIGFNIYLKSQATLFYYFDTNDSSAGYGIPYTTIRWSGSAIEYYDGAYNELCGYNLGGWLSYTHTINWSDNGAWYTCRNDTARASVYDGTRTAGSSEDNNYSGIGTGNTNGMELWVDQFAATYGKENIFITYPVPAHVVVGAKESNAGPPATLKPYITNVSNQEYRLNHLTPVLEINATNNFNWTLMLHNTNGTNYTINSSNEAAGDWYNNTQTVNTSEYGDGIYYLNLSAIDSAHNEAYNLSSNFTIQNLEVKLWNVTGEVYTQSNDLVEPDIEIYTDLSATADLTLYNGASSWAIASWSISAGNYSNSSIEYNVSNFSESDNYYIILNVTKTATGITESNTTSNFTIDTQGPNISFDWNLIEGGWVSSINTHGVDLLIDDLTDTGIINCTIDSNGNDLSKSGCSILNTSTRQEATSFYRVAWNSSEFNGSYIYAINVYLRVNETPSTATTMAGVILQNGTEYNSSAYTSTSSTYSLKEVTTNSNGKVEWVNLYIKNNNGNFTQVKNWTINHTGFIDGNNYSFPVPIQQGTNTFNITCRDKRNNSNDYTADSINIDYTKLTIMDEDNRTEFPICNYSDPRMIVQPSGTGNISYESIDCSEMTDSYFILMNDSIESIRLAIGTLYYRGLTDYEDILGNITLYMYNYSKQTSSQILFIIETEGYEKPILIRRPRDDGEQDITSEYPIGDDNEVNAYLLDSRLYNIYAYDILDNLILIDSLMVAGAREIHIIIPDLSSTFTDVLRSRSVIGAINYSDDNYTVYCIGYDPDGVSFTIGLYNYSNDLLTSGSFSETGTLTYDAGNVSLLNNTYFYCLFNYGETVHKRVYVIGEDTIYIPVIDFYLPESLFVTILSVAAILIMLAIAGAMAYYVGEIGLLVAAGIGMMLYAFLGLQFIVFLFALMIGILGGGFMILKK